MALITETPIDTEIALLSTVIGFQQIVTINLEFFIDGLINPGVIRPEEEYEMEEY